MIIYQYNGSLDGYLTAVSRGIECNLDSIMFMTDSSTYQLSFLDEIVPIESDMESGDALMTRLKRMIGTKGISNIIHAFDSADSQKDIIIYNYITLALAKGKDVLSMLSHPYVILFNDIVHKVLGEIHKMSGFLRFVKTKNGNYYAAYSPENNITNYLMAEFTDRLSDMSFALHDVPRGIIGIYNGKDYVILKDAERVNIEYADDEKWIEQLWQKYYATVNIKERYNPRQMLRYMPRKYTNNIYTFHDFE